MMKEVVRAMDTGVLAEIGLIAFMIAFVLIAIKVVMMKSSVRNTAKHIPLQDAEELPVSSNNE